MAGLHYKNSVMRKAFIIPATKNIKKWEITSDLFGKDLFKRLKQSLGKVVEELVPHQQFKKPLRTSNWDTGKTCQEGPGTIHSRLRS